MFFGPRVIGPRALPYFLDYNPEALGAPDTWDPTHFPVIACIAAGLRVMDVPVPYGHPMAQTQAEGTPEMILKRVRQLDELTQGTFKYARQLGLMK